MFRSTTIIRELALNLAKIIFTLKHSVKLRLYLLCGCVAACCSTLDLELRKKLVKCYIWSIALCGAETWTLRAVDRKHLESFEKWCWKRMEKGVGTIM